MRGAIAFGAFLILYWFVLRQLGLRLDAQRISFVQFGVGLGIALALFPIWMVLAGGVDMSPFTVIVSSVLLLLGVVVSAWVYWWTSRRPRSR